MKSALIVWGGWEGHEPQAFAARIAKELEDRNYHVVKTCNFSVLLNGDLKKYDVIIPVWSCGIKGELYLNKLIEAVKGGVGLVAFHGGINWFEDEKYYEMIGGFYLYDTGLETYCVGITQYEHPITAGISGYQITSEKFYLMPNPEIQILASANFSGITMPIAWCKNFGNGRVFYSSLAHTAEQFFSVSNFNMVARAIDWASNMI